MVKAYMAKSWRHPVFGTDRWVQQRGKDWFYKPLRGNRENFQRVMVRAIQAGAEAIANNQ